MEKITINTSKNYALPKALKQKQSKSKDNKKNYAPLILRQDSKRYIVGTDIEGTTLSECHEKFSGRDFKCQLLPSSKEVGQLEAHMRMTKSVHVAFPVDLFLEADSQYLVFEKGHGNMHTQIKDLKVLPEEVAKALFLQMVEAVADCHSGGIVLNDVKLRRFIFSNSLKTNLCIESLNGCVLLRPGESDDKRYSKKSNPFYISPEAIRGGKDGYYKGRPSDVWSLGIMMYTMLCGKYPFHDVNPITQLSKIVGGKYITPPGMSFDAKCLISKMLNRDPNERLSAKAILSHAWFDSPEDLKNIALKLEKFEERIHVVPTA